MLWRGHAVERTCCGEGMLWRGHDVERICCRENIMSLRQAVRGGHSVQTTCGGGKDMLWHMHAPLHQIVGYLRVRFL